MHLFLGSTDVCTPGIHLSICCPPLVQKPRKVGPLELCLRSTNLVSKIWFGLSVLSAWPCRVWCSSQTTISTCAQLLQIVILVPLSILYLPLQRSCSLYLVSLTLGWLAQMIVFVVCAWGSLLFYGAVSCGRISSIISLRYIFVNPSGVLPSYLGLAGRADWSVVTVFLAYPAFLSPNICHKVQYRNLASFRCYEWCPSFKILASSISTASRYSYFPNPKSACGHAK